MSENAAGERNDCIAVDTVAAMQEDNDRLREALRDQRESWQQILTAEERGFTVGGYAEGTAKSAIARIDTLLASGGEGGA